MYACLTEVVFHDCTTTSGLTGHPPSETDFLRSTDGQKRIAKGIAEGICEYFGKNCTPTVAPTKGRFRGVVYRSTNIEDKLEGALVQVSGGDSITTGADGAFNFELETGTHTVTASLNGFETASSTREVTANEDVWGSIGLEETAPIGNQDAGDDTNTPKLDANTPNEDAPNVPTDAATNDANNPPNNAYWDDDEASGCSCRLASSENTNKMWFLLASTALLLGMIHRQVTQSRGARSRAKD
jgi:hypothetical protein